MLKFFLSVVLVVVAATSAYLVHRAKDRPRQLRMVLYTKLGWSILGAVILLWLILSGKLIF